MTADVERLKKELAALDAVEREALCHFLEDTLPEGEVDEDPELTAELERREAEFLSGESPGVPAEEVFARLLAKGK